MEITFQHPLLFCGLSVIYLFFFNSYSIDIRYLNIPISLRLKSHQLLKKSQTTYILLLEIPFVIR